MMKQDHCASTILWRIRTFPLSLLNLSMSKRLLIVLLSYAIAIPALWFFYPRLNNAASMILPILCLCWFFSYRGLLISILSLFGVIWLIYHYLSGYTLSYQTIIVRTLIGLILVLLLGLTICWLRAALDLVQVARQQALTEKQERLLALEREHLATLGYEQQRKINEMKDQFLLNVSHELRTPMTVLGGSLELLKEFHDRLEPQEREQALTQALASQEELADLINLMLDTTTMESAILQAHPKAIYIYQLLQEVLSYLTYKSKDIDAYTISLHVPTQITVWADPHLLRQVIQHLFSNIFKYVPQQTEIHIEATQATPTSPVYLSIQDAGPGLPPEELPLLFEKFVRLKRDLAGTTRGMGLGLYISKQLIEAMHGHIRAESSGLPGEGTRIILTLLPPEPIPTDSTPHPSISA
jgi:signal transduction histidine kinase